MVKNKDKTIVFKLTLKQFKHLQDCLRIIQDGLSINEAIQKSALAILAELGKEDIEEMDKLVAQVIKLDVG